MVCKLKNSYDLPRNFYHTIISAQASLHLAYEMGK